MDESSSAAATACRGLVDSIAAMVRMMATGKSMKPEAWPGWAKATQKKAVPLRAMKAAARTEVKGVARSRSLEKMKVDGAARARAKAWAGLKTRKASQPRSRERED